MSHVDGVDDGKLYGVYGRTPTGYGVSGKSPGGYGVIGESDTGHGLFGISHSDDSNGTGVIGQSENGNGVVGSSRTGTGVYGTSISGEGVHGYSGKKYGIGVLGGSNDGYGVSGAVWAGVGVHGLSNKGTGVVAVGTDAGVRASSSEGPGVVGHSNVDSGVYGESPTLGVYGRSYAGAALLGWSERSRGYGAFIYGRVAIVGKLEKAGGSFKIDHPLDPANKYLHHSFVESSDMKNIYDGLVILDESGSADVYLPDWFFALNKDFRYQLTAIGASASDLYVAEEIHEPSKDCAFNSDTKPNCTHFKIAGGSSGLKVSWQITGIRKDPWANIHRIQVEEEKSDKERGHYLYPDLYNQPVENGISHILFPEQKQVSEKSVFDRSIIKKNDN
jgi:hypothetical protein